MQSAVPAPLFAFLLAGLMSGLFNGVLRRPSAAEIMAMPGNGIIERVKGPVLVLSPHYDDESLGCGGTIALLAARTEVHVLHITDGSLVRSKDLGAKTPKVDEMPAIRHAEARKALDMLGISAEHAHKLALPDGHLTKHATGIEQGLRAYLLKIRPRAMFVPFRHDQHPDHLAVWRAASRLIENFPPMTLLEYFVYNRYAWLPQRDIRRMIRPALLLSVDIETARAQKRAALQAYTSQTTCFLPHQTRPVLDPALLEAQCTGPELFLQADAKLPDRKLFKHHSWILRLSIRYGFRIVQWKKNFWPAPIR